MKDAINEYKAYYESEIGLIEVISTATAIKSLYFIEPEEKDDAATSEELPHALNDCMAQLDEYFKGGRRQFSLPLAPEGTTFQQTVWHQLSHIPFGETVSYLDIARAVNNDKAVRAVGAANGQNPISIILPCHRVIGSNGKLTGYGGGLWRKEWLLNHEGVVVGKQMRLF